MASITKGFNYELSVYNSKIERRKRKVKRLLSIQLPNELIEKTKIKNK